MERIKIDPSKYPIQQGESWWLVHPNNSNAEFRIPVGAITLCTESFLGFDTGTVYQIVNNDSSTGWITLVCRSEIVEMPYYVFARHFDSEAFVRRAPSREPLKPPHEKLERFYG